jgi:tetratricopeptide (TPR) repeat protein
VFDQLRALEEQADLGGDDLELRACWFAWQAVTWASLRDFARAETCIEHADRLAAKDSWAWSCESQVRGLADRWEDALKAAERAWEMSPGAPYAAQSLGDSLIHLGRVQESAKRLAAAADDSESYEVALLACWHQCALAETLNGEERLQVLDRAHGLAENLPALAPLADRETVPVFARARLDISVQLDDYEQVERWAREVDSPFYRRVLENRQKNPSGRRILLHFRRAIQRHEACLPTSVSSALAAMGVRLDPDMMASEITYGGTPFWTADEWLEKRGLVVRFFMATPQVATRLIQNGIAFVLSLEADDNSHAVAVVGMDESAGTLVIHDPQAFRTNEYLLEGMEQIKSPLGPKGMAVVPADKASLLDRLLEGADTEVMTACHRHQRAFMTKGPAAARQVLDELTDRQPQHSGTRWLRAVQFLEDGRNGEALAEFQRLLNEFPGCPCVRWSLLSACRALANTALMREVLANVVKCGRLPGIQSDQNWRYPPASYVCEYANLLRLSAASRQEARLLLNSLLRRDSAFAGAWHVLGDLLWHERDMAGALLSFRLASCLARSDEHYARAYSDALRAVGREGEALSWLETRVRTFGTSSRAIGTWTSWLSALEDYGYPDRALAACGEALEHHGRSPELLAFAVPFLARLGHWEDSEAGLCRLEATGHRALYLQAAVDFHRMRGNLDAAIQLAEEWVRESSQSMPAHQQLLELTTKRHGARVAVDLGKRWCLENPGHEPLEEIYSYQLDRLGSGWKKDLVLHRRVKRNAEDGWAWRELTFRRLNDYERANQERREKLHLRIMRLLTECDRTAPKAAATLASHAEWHAVRGQWSEAVAAWLEAIEAEPGNFHGYRRIWECAARLDAAERGTVYQQVERILLGYPGRLSNAREMLFLLAEQFGIDAAEEAVLRWKSQRGDEPELIEAAADLLLTYGHGRTDAGRALAMLQPAVGCFPYYAGVRLSLADTYRRLRKDSEAEETLREVIRRHPDNTGAHVQLAWVQEWRGNGDEALRLLQSAAARDPLSPEVWDARVGILIRNRRFSDARAALQEGLQRLAENVYWRERAIQRLLECGDDEGAVEAAREGVRIYPRGAYLWHLLGTTLRQAGRFAAPGEIESCFRRSLSLNGALFAAADSLATLLAEQRRCDEAEELMRLILPRLADPSPAQGRLAWIRRQEGHKEEALEEIVSVLRAAPLYRWGWRVALDWLVEDQAWEKARGVLCPCPTELRTDTVVRRRRLSVLEQAGLSTDELEGEWNDLLRDFSEDVPLHLERYDILRADKRMGEAAAVLNAIRPVDPENPYLLARLVEVFANEHKRDEALEALLRIWFAEVEESPWPADYAWKAVQNANCSDEAYERAGQRLSEGLRLTPQALSIMAAYAMRRDTQKRRQQPRWRAWFPDAGVREVMALLDLVDNARWSDGPCRATLFRQLSNFGYHRLVVGRWKKMRAVVESDVDSWSEVGRALLELGRKKEARNLLAGWRERTGITMGMVANYILCFPRRERKHLQEVLLASRDALAGLPHDHCAKYLAHVQAEMCVSLGDTEAFRQTWVRHRNYFSGKLEESEWFESQRKHLLADIPCLARLLEQNRTKLFSEARRDLLRKQGASDVFSTSGAGGGPKVPWWLWWPLFWAAIQALESLLKQTSRP